MAVYSKSVVSATRIDKFIEHTLTSKGERNMSRTNLTQFITKLRSHFTSALDGKTDLHPRDVELAFERAVNQAALGDASTPTSTPTSKVPAGSKAAKDRAKKGAATRAKNKAAREGNLTNIEEAAKTGSGVAQ